MKDKPMTKLTIINQQYPPEVVSTGQIFRMMAEYLAGSGFSVTVVTGTPYYPGLSKKPPRRERMGGVSVRRLRNTTFDKRSLPGKLMNLLTFEISLFFYCLFRIPKENTVLVATAPPMAVLCTAIGSFFRRYRVVMTVQDLYPDVLAASGMSSEKKLSYRILKALMRRSMRACDQVVTISADMQRHLMMAYGVSDVRLIPNMTPDDILPVDACGAKAARGWQDKLVVQYSGNFGMAHEMETLLDTARLLRDDPGILFQIAGAGRNYDRLRAACEADALTNIVFEGYAPIEALSGHLGTADISIVILSAAFRDVLLPSKYYGILASGRAVLLISGCESDISRDIKRESIGMAFGHGDSAQIAKALTALAQAPAVAVEMGVRARALYDEKYARGPILEAYAALLKGH